MPFGKPGGGAGAKSKGACAGAIRLFNLDLHLAVIADVKVRCLPLWCKDVRERVRTYTRVLQTTTWLIPALVQDVFKRLYGDRVHITDWNFSFRGDSLRDGSQFGFEPSHKIWYARN